MNIHKLCILQSGSAAVHLEPLNRLSSDPPLQLLIEKTELLYGSLWLPGDGNSVKLVNLYSRLSRTGLTRILYSHYCPLPRLMLDGLLSLFGVFFCKWRASFTS